MKVSSERLALCSDGLDTVRHTMHHLDLAKLEKDHKADLEAFYLAVDTFEKSSAESVEDADEAWDTIVELLLPWLPEYGDGSDELDDHRDDLVNLSEDSLGTHNARTAFAYDPQDERDNNPRSSAPANGMAFLVGLGVGALAYHLGKKR